MSVFQQTTEGSLSVAVKQTLAHTCSHDAASSRLSIQKIKMPRTPKPKHAPRQISMAQPLHGPLLFAWPSEVAARAKSMLPRRGYRFPSCMHPDHCPQTHAAVVWLTTQSGAERDKRLPREKRIACTARQTGPAISSALDIGACGEERMPAQGEGGGLSTHDSWTFRNYCCGCSCCTAFNAAELCSMRAQPCAYV